MKIILIFVFTIRSILSIHAQDNLFSPIELNINDEFDSKDELYSDSDNRYYSTLSHVFLYERNDSNFITYLRNGSLKEFVFGTNWELDPEKIRSIEFIENDGSNDLLVIKTQFYKSNTYSASTLWFENRIRWTIINLGNHSIIFDFDVVANYYQELYSYNEDIYNDSISEKEMNKIIEERKIEIIQCGFEYHVLIDKTSIIIESVNPMDINDDYCPSLLKEGVFEITNKGYKRK